MNKKLFFIIILSSVSIFSQEIRIESEKGTTFRIMPSYQIWNGINDSEIKQSSALLFLNYFIDRDTRVSLQGGYGSSEVYDRRNSGLSDAQLSVNHKLRKYNLGFDLGVNIPTGKEKITAEFFPSTVLLSQDVFSLNLPVLGQGLNVLAGVTWAKDIGDNIAIGFGTSYQFKGEYNPISEDTISYKPSNELFITGGIDIRLNNFTTLSGDITGILYGKDKINDEESFSAGTKTIFSLIFRQFYDHNSLILFIRYRNSEVEKINELTDFIPTDKINPNSVMVLAQFKHYLSRIFSLYYILEGRFYEKTTAPFSGYKLFGLGISAGINLSSALSVPISVKYYKANSDDSSSINGMEFGTGLAVRF